jgi:hypothetical protein
MKRDLSWVLFGVVLGFLAHWAPRALAQDVSPAPIQPQPTLTVNTTNAMVDTIVWQQSVAYLCRAIASISGQAKAPVKCVPNTDTPQSPGAPLFKVGTVNYDAGNRRLYGLVVPLATQVELFNGTSAWTSAPVIGGAWSFQIPAGIAGVRNVMVRAWYRDAAGRIVTIGELDNRVTVTLP